MLISKSMEKTFRRLKSKDVRAAYVEAELCNGIAAQIKRLRLDRGWSQSDLAKKIKTTQNTISRLEDPSYGRFTIKTLLALSKAFDVALLARFMPFSGFMPVVWDTSPDALTADGYDDESETVHFVSSYEYISSIAPGQQSPVSFTATQGSLATSAQINSYMAPAIAHSQTIGKLLYDRQS